jgi:hypothetical protein
MGEMMEESEPGSSHSLRRIALRWKVLQAVGVILIALGTFVDWAPRVDPSLPETSSFLLMLGTLVGAAGLFAGMWQE